MSRPFKWVTNEWGESKKQYFDDDPPPDLQPTVDMGGVKDDPWGPHRDWQRRNKTRIKDVRYDDDRDPYDDV